MASFLSGRVRAGFCLAATALDRLEMAAGLPRVPVAVELGLSAHHGGLLVLVPAGAGAAPLSSRAGSHRCICAIWGCCGSPRAAGTCCCTRSSCKAPRGSTTLAGRRPTTRGSCFATRSTTISSGAAPAAVRCGRHTRCFTCGRRRTGLCRWSIGPRIRSIARSGSA